MRVYCGPSLDPFGTSLMKLAAAHLMSQANVLLGPTGIMNYFHSNMWHINKSLLEIIPYSVKLTGVVGISGTRTSLYSKVISDLEWTLKAI